MNTTMNSLRLVPQTSVNAKTQPQRNAHNTILDCAHCVAAALMEVCGTSLSAKPTV